MGRSCWRRSRDGSHCHGHRVHTRRGRVASRAYFVSQSDQATAGFDDAAGIIITVLFAITVVPAFALVLTRKLPRTALTLALAFPAIFAILFVAVIIAFT